MAFEKNLAAGSSIFLPKTISGILAEVSTMDDLSLKSSKLDYHILAMEEEMGKIDAFKRELPHCMHLLRDAIERLKEERSHVGPATEEFMPLKGGSNSEGGAGAKGSNDEKKNWLSSVQLWSTPIQYDTNIEKKNQESLLTLRSRYHQQEEEGSGSGYLFQGCNLKGRGSGAFLPFKKPTSVTIEDQEKRPPVQLHHGLSLSINPVADELESINELSSVKHESGSVRPQMQESQQQRKQRRCWSPELHRTFVDALQQLGGAQTATPKQIRELMKVDGLTNDEVKSHLQKYRLHIRKLPRPPAGDYSWLTRDHDLGAHSGSPQDHLNLRGGSGKGGGSGNGGDSMEDEEDDKSESRSWKKTAA